MTDDAELGPRLDRITGSGVPGQALAFFGRWWQLETWLREMVYVELRAMYGPGWTKHLQGQAPRRAAGDEVNSYMASADAGELLAYTDVSALFELIEAQWRLFDRLLPDRTRWLGTSDELRGLRHRNAHCRRPHRDDLARIEQALRDLEPGARRFYISYLNDRPLQRSSQDPLARAWIDGDHPTASRLLEHARNQYGVEFRLGYSVRPWASWPDPDHVSASAGVLWHASWILSGPEVLPMELWREVQRRSEVTSPLVHLLMEFGHVTATFSALEPPDIVADAIGRVFDLILTNGHPRRLHDLEDIDQYMPRWRAGTERLPRQVQIDTPLTLVDPFHPEAFSIFAAG